METFSFRPATMEYLESVHRIISAQNTMDYGEPLRSLSGLCELWGSTGFNLKTDTLIAFASNGDTAGFVELLNKEDPYIYLAGDYQQAELAVQLLSRIEKCAASQKKTDGPLTLYGRAVNSNQVIRHVFESGGYVSNLSFLVMELTLAEEPPAPQWSDGIRVRTFIKNQDEQATYRADEEAAEDKGYHTPLSFDDWAKRMSLNSDLFDSGIWFLAHDGDEIAGVALNVIAKDSNTGWVDHLSVRRAWRKRGIGKALLLHTFRELYRRGVCTIKLSVDSKSLTNAPKLYESVGMKVVQHYHVYIKELQV